MAWQGYKTSIPYIFIRIIRIDWPPFFFVSILIQLPNGGREDTCDVMPRHKEDPMDIETLGLITVKSPPCQLSTYY